MKKIDQILSQVGITEEQWEQLAKKLAVDTDKLSKAINELAKSAIKMSNDLNAINLSMKPVSKIFFDNVELMNHSLFYARLGAKHKNISKIAKKDKSNYAWLIIWAENAENIWQNYSIQSHHNQEIAYRNYCNSAIKIMGDNYSLVKINYYKDKIEKHFKEIEAIEKDPYAVITESIFESYCHDFKFSVMAKRHMRDPSIYIHFVKFVEKMVEEELKPSDVYEVLKNDAIERSQTLEIRFSYSINSILLFHQKYKAPKQNALSLLTRQIKGK